LVTNIAIIGSAVSCSVTTTWQIFTVTVDVPGSIDNLLPIFWTDSQFSANDILDVTECGLYLASGQVLPWQPRPYAEELALCQRYYEKSFNVDQSPIQASGTFVGVFSERAQTAVASGGQVFYKVLKPNESGTITLYNPTQAAASWRNSSDAANAVATAIIPGSNGFFANNTTATAGVWCIHWSVDADL
jgi:hypothetical protein